MAFGRNVPDKDSGKTEGNVTYVEVDGETYVMMPKSEYESLAETAHLLSNAANAAVLREGVDFFERNAPTAKVIEGPVDEIPLQKALFENLQQAFHAGTPHGALVTSWAANLVNLSVLTDLKVTNWCTFGHGDLSQLKSNDPRQIKGLIVPVIKMSETLGKFSPARQEHPTKVGNLGKRGKTTTD